ncbi:dihydrolipoyl dehydrogenase family protein [Alkalilimnicola ehrlichii MLHE-1]|uniref:Pyridine nucleotide-disulfide oxidoreductase dimerization region n=1 Tax=Alkalilimnicola ehrlichii (strain ATCC BAA-1101 / DSM 17681 / MLHE-1) TaxID=187272 RepID=Q0AAN2_ALKEH|nr:FAD-dependent oxidoreductase [Alkalilimnicola ehrlichii]ABI56105.1 pyridine nucleotide-disulfide oxidoreductase dimerization region [Alkalilimnicola ehrlichii MLHE-1]
MKQDLIIIGGGVGGLVTASVAGQLGVKTVLIDAGANLGGDCLHYGCVPSKTLIRSAEVAALTRRAGEFGLQAELGPVDLGAVMDRVRQVIDQIQVHDDPDRFRGYGVDVRFGHARFLDRDTVSVDGERLQARRFVIATGSAPAVPPVPGLAEAGFHTNETIFQLRTLPRRLAVMGGGPIGIELAQAFSRLGSQVTVVEMAAQILPRDDAEQAAELRSVLDAEGITVHTATTVERVEQSEGITRLACRNGESHWTVTADALLLAAGRKPNLDLGLEAAGVAYGPRGIRVDRRQRSSVRHIYAVGDCCGPYPFTHMAEYQAGIVIANALFRIPKKVDYRVVPWVTYTAPELATVGLTEDEARARNLKVEVLRFPFREVDRALAEGETAGQAKLIVRRGRLVGASVLGPHAGELIHEAVLAIQARLRVGTLAAAIHAYPTLAQVFRRAVNTRYTEQLYSDRTRKLVAFLQRWLPGR